MGNHEMEQPSGHASRVGALTILVLCLWLATTYLFWTGYVGAADDKNYAHYAFELNRPPSNWWEFRIPFILALRASFLVFGPSELAAALPNLIMSLSIVAAVAWFTGWWRKSSWQTLAAALIAVTFPLGVGFRSTVLAPFFAGSLLIVGTACFLRGSRGVQALGAMLLAAGYATHEVAFFYVAILCITSLFFERQKYWRPVLICVAASAAVVLTEGIVYKILLHDALARFRTSSGAMVGNLGPGFDASSNIYGVRFYTWPLENLIFSKNFGFDLLLLLVSGVFVWRRFAVEQRILFTVTFLTWAYLGYGTLEPWKYQPLYRQMHYYIVIMFGVSALLPWTITWLTGGRRWLSQAILGGTILVQLACCAAGGRWGQNVGVSRVLLSFVQSHSGQTFLADKNSMDEMYMVNGFRFPANVVCLNGPEVEQHLIVNEGPAGMPKFRFPEAAIDGILVNRESLGNEPGFTEYMGRHPGTEETLTPLKYKLIFSPISHVIQPREFMIRSKGGAVIWLSGDRTTRGGRVQGGQ